MSDFFHSHAGNAKPLLARWRGRAWCRLLDFLFDMRVRLGSGLRNVRSADQSKSARVLLVGIEVPTRAADIHRVIDRLRDGSHQQITVSVAPMLDQGKFANIETAIAKAPAPLSSFDWLVITDDDIAFRRGFLDDLIAIAAAADLALSQPCHAWLSHATYSITQRKFGVLARRTNFVEIGPLTLVRADLFSAIAPFPASRWCYGIDLVWSVMARRAGLKIGIVDGVPVRHLRPVAVSYDIDAARQEGQALTETYRIRENRAEFFGVNETLLSA